MKKILTAFARNTVFANIVLVIIFVSGWIATKSMIRENFPEFSLDLITVTVEYLGAAPEEVEEAVCARIEERVADLESVDKALDRAAR